LPRILITNLSLCLIEEEPFQRKQRPDHVFAYSLCLSLGLSPDFTVEVETWMLPAENLLYKGKADELFPKQQGEDLMGEDLADALIMEAGDMVEGAIWGCAPLCCQDMDVGMEIDTISESLDHRHHSWHELMACDGPKIFQEGMNGCKR